MQITPVTLSLIALRLHGHYFRPVQIPFLLEVFIRGQPALLVLLHPTPWANKTLLCSLPCAGLLAPCRTELKARSQLPHWSEGGSSDGQSAARVTILGIETVAGAHDWLAAPPKKCSPQTKCLYLEKKLLCDMAYAYSLYPRSIRFSTLQYDTCFLALAWLNRHSH